MRRGDALDGLKRIVIEHETVRDAVSWASTLTDPAHLELRKITASSVGDRARLTLNGTYLIRAFTTFEASVVDYWNKGCGRRTRPVMKVLLAAVAARQGMPHDWLFDVQEVREVRNHIIHEDRDWNAMAVQISVQRMRRYLSMFPLSW